MSPTPPGYTPVLVTVPARRRDIDGLIVLPNQLAFHVEDMEGAVVVLVDVAEPAGPITGYLVRSDGAEHAFPPDAEILTVRRDDRPREESR